MRLVLHLTQRGISHRPPQLDPRRRGLEKRLEREVSVAMAQEAAMAPKVIENLRENITMLVGERQILANFYALYRRIVGHNGPRRRAANVLRDEGKELKKGDLARALVLADLSIEMNPLAGYARTMSRVLFGKRKARG